MIEAWGIKIKEGEEIRKGEGGRRRRSRRRERRRRKKERLKHITVISWQANLKFFTHIILFKVTTSHV